MDQIKSKVEYYFEHVKGYLTTNLELFKLKIIEKSALAFSSLFSSIILLLICFVFILLFSVGLSLKLAEFFNSPSTGFFLVSLIYLVIAIVLFLFRKQLLIMPLMNFFIGTIQNSFKSDDEEN
ncbi:MAG: hypothetical protein M3Q58_12980 [Bacteroidota bacterium]|nr:hypothetical protein [Bacteroidota bacterium]